VALDTTASLLPAADPDAPDLLWSSSQDWRDRGLARPAVLVGKLLALADTGAIPLVGFPGQQGLAAVRARTTIDLLAEHVGLDVLLAFDEDDRARPIVIGLLRGQRGWPGPAVPSQVQVEADGRRLTVCAQEELVLRCGRARITLTADGQLELRADVIVSEASGVNRVRGGSVQLN
jgi:Domain of unknown function (DUF6484)